MICRNCGNETGSRYDCTVCGYDPTKDDPAVKRNAKAPPEEVKLPPLEIKLKKRANVPAIFGFICSILMFIPIPVIGVVTCPGCYIASLILTIVGFAKAKSCRSGRGFSIVSLILVILLSLLAIGIVVAITAFGVGGGFLSAILAALGMQEY